MKKTTPIREEWSTAWRTARTIHKSKPQNPEALCDLSGLLSCAWYRVTSRDMPDPILATPEQNMVATQIINEILTEEANMTLTEFTEIEAELLRTIDDAEYASRCAHAAIGNLYNSVRYTLIDIRSSMRAAKNAHEAAARALDLLTAAHNNEES